MNENESDGSLIDVYKLTEPILGNAIEQTEISRLNNVIQLVLIFRNVFELLITCVQIDVDATLDSRPE